MAAVAHASGSGELVPLRDSASSAAAAAALAAMQTGSVSPAVFLNAKAALMAWSSVAVDYIGVPSAVYTYHPTTAESAPRVREKTAATQLQSPPRRSAQCQ